MKKNVLIVLVLAVIVLNISATDSFYSMEEELSALKKELSVAEDKLLLAEDELVAVKKELFVEQLQNETLAIEYDELMSENFFTVIWLPDFLDFIHDNPIDKTLENSEHGYSTMDMVNVVSSYCELWDAEMQNSILTLKKFLTEDDYEELLEGQKAWESYVKSSTYIDAVLLSGSASITQVMSNQSQKTRARAIELLGYIYIFTNEVSFVFIEN